MALVVEDEVLHDMNFLWESRSWDPSNSDNSCESTENMKSSPTQKEEKDESVMNKKRNRDQSSIGSRASSTLEMHVWTERERRKKMRNMFATLHALLPHLSSKADKSAVVEEAVKYIKNLEETLEKLEKKKQERVQYCAFTSTCESPSMFATGPGSSNSFSKAIVGASSNALSFTVQQHRVVSYKTWASSNLVLNICGDEAQYSICSAHKPGLMSAIAFVLNKYNIDLITANITCNGNGNGCMVQAHEKRVSHQFLDEDSLEEIYKQAAGEIMLWIA